MLTTYLKYSLVYFASITFGIANGTQAYGQEGYFLEQHDQDKEKRNASNEPHHDGLPYYEGGGGYGGGGEENPDDGDKTQPDKEAHKTTTTSISKKAAPTAVSKKKNPTNTNSPTNTEEKQENSERENSESVLSFNFLYYIIEKFKFSDVLK